MRLRTEYSYDCYVPTVLVPNYKMKDRNLEMNNRNTTLNTLNNDNVILTVSIA